MKSKGSASLYEVLKSASRGGSGAASGGVAAPETPAAANDAQKSLQERLAEYKARKLADAQAPASTAVAVADPTPVPVSVDAADPTPPPAPSLPTRVLTPLPQAQEPETKPPAGPGERVFKLTYNTAAFAALVVVGLVFVAYAIGVKSGRSRAAEAAPEALGAPSIPKPAPPPILLPPPAPKVYSIHLIEWPDRNPQEHLKAIDQADRCKSALERGGFKNVEMVKITRAGEQKLALYIDRLKDTASEPARSRLSSIQKVKVQNQTPFAQAAFEEMPK